MNDKEIRASFLEALVIKASTKQAVYNNTLQTFKILKKVLIQLEKNYRNIIKVEITEY